MSDRNEILRRVRADGGPSLTILNRCRKMVSDLTGPNRGIDTILSDVLGLVPEGYWRTLDLGVRYAADLQSGVIGPDWFPPKLTGSTDAALDLIGQQLPEFGYRLQTQLGGRLPVCTLHAPPADPDASITDSRSWSRQHEGGGASLPLAIVSAVLKAKIAQLEASHAR